jgi:uncharacterized protein YpmS
MLDDEYREERSSSGILILVAGAAFLLAIGTLVWMFFLQSRLTNMEAELRQAQEQNAQQTIQINELHRQLRATTEAFGAKVGITQRQIESRAADILRQQESANNRMTAKLSQQISQQAATTRKQVNGVSADVSSVKTDVANTKKELADTEQQLHAAMGDLGMQSGLIARNGQELELLKHRGDRNYFAFTLHKGRPPIALSTIKLQLRKADTKHSRYTLEIFSDDRRIEKKNRDLDEPLQFYSGKPPLLFEIVINQVGKNQVSGYLSTPKSAPQPVTP